MSNFDFLKNFNRELYEIGNKLEEDVMDSPRAVPADATLFLETLVNDIYRLSQTKLKSVELPFYQKIDLLYRSGVITYIYKNKLQDAYNLRNKIHQNTKNINEESRIAMDLHQRLYYISKKYFRDYSGVTDYVKIPDYKKPSKEKIHFENCIICGEKNNNVSSNMCDACNEKIENANYVMSLKNTFGDESLFSKQDIMDYGIGESEAISLIMDLTQNNLIVKRGNYYYFNEKEFNDYIGQINQFVKIGLLLNKFYREEISSEEIKKTLEYWKGSKDIKPYVQFYNLVNEKIIHDFEKELLKTDNIKLSIKNTQITNGIIKDWFLSQKLEFISGGINEAFITYNELLISEYFTFKKKGLDGFEIKKQLGISDEYLSFWKEDFMRDDFLKTNNDIKKYLIIKALKNNKSLNEALKYADITQYDFDKLLLRSKNADDKFYKEFNNVYTIKRQKSLIKNLKNNYLSIAIRKSKISRAEFLDWYFKGEIEYSDFYIKCTRLLMKQYLNLRRQGMKKTDILFKMTLPKEIIKSWLDHDDLEMFRNFKSKNQEITSVLLKRGLIINALKEDKSKKEAIEAANITQEEFDEIYNQSVREKSDFHIRFDEEYTENRKRLFVRLLEANDFYNSIVKCGISQKEFIKWYQKEESAFMANKSENDFYQKTTELLMDKYIQSRRSGKNKPDSARSVGLSNLNIDKWLKHQEFSLFRKFKSDIEKLNIHLIRTAFSEGQSKREVNENFDIPLKTIDRYINKSKVGLKGYEDIHRLYESVVIPNQIEIFLEEIKTKPFKKALKNSNFTEDDFNYYYNLGMKGDNEFTDFYKKYCRIKIVLYVNSILDKKSEKIALKNSNLTPEEFKQIKSKIQDLILNTRIDIVYDLLMNHDMSTSYMANHVGITVNELYDWYFKGKQGDETFKEFAMLFEVAVIIPRVMAINRAAAIGIPKNKLMKKLKKDIGSTDYKIWKDNNIIENYDENIVFEGDIDLDKEKLLSLFNNSEVVRCVHKDDDPEMYEMMKKAIQGNSIKNAKIIKL